MWTQVLAHHMNFLTDPALLKSEGGGGAGCMQLISEQKL